MKKHFILCSFLFASFVSADALSDILSENKNLLFDYELQSNDAQSDMLEDSWINPIMVQYARTYSEQYGEKTVQTGSFSVGVDQPIFRSGGIYYAIKFAQAQREGNKAQIRLKKQEMITQAVKLLFQIKKVKLEQKKLALLIKNDKINIYQQRQSYKAGIIDSSFLDQALLKKNQDETKAIELEMNLEKLKMNFSVLSDKNPKRCKVPKLHLLSASRYKGSNLELVRDRLNSLQKKYNAKMTWAKYMPAISVQGRYVDADINPLFQLPNSTLKERYFTYGFSISMPLNINMFSDIEANKVAHLKAQSEVIERKSTIDAEYALIKKKVALIDKKIKLSNQDTKLYARLYRTTKNQVKSGEKTRYDAQMMLHSLKIRKLDKQIYDYDKQIELLALYAKVSSEI